MNDFDPAAYLAEKTPATSSPDIPVDQIQLDQFNPAKYLNDKSNAQFANLQSKYGGLGQQVLAGVEGAAKGFTFGLSPAIEVASGLSTPEAIAGREEANPITSPVAQGTGFLGFNALTGGIAAPAEAGAAAIGLGPLAAKVAGYGLEGAGIGAGNSVSDYALGDPSLNAQKVLANIGMGAAFGGSLGVISRGAELVLPKAAAKLGSALSNLKESVLGTAENPSFLVRTASVPGGLATGQAPADWAQTLFEGVQNAGTKVNDKIMEMRKNFQEVFNAHKEARTELYDTAKQGYKSALEDLEMTTPDAQKAASPVLQHIYDLVKPTGNLLPGEEVESILSPSTQKQFEPILQKLEEKVSFPTSSNAAGEIHGALDQFAKDLDDTIKFDKIPTAAQQGDQDILRQIRGIVRGNLKDPEVWGWAGPHYEATTEIAAEGYKAEKAFQKYLMEKNPATGKYEVSAKKVKALFNNINDPGQFERKNALNGLLKAAKETADASQNLAGSQAAAESISGRISKLAKERAELRDLAETLQNQKKVGRSTLSGINSEAALSFAANAVGVPHPVIGSALATFEAVKAIKNPYQVGATLGPALDKLQVIGNMVSGIDKKLVSMSKSIFSKSNAMIPSLESAAGGYDGKVERLQELAGNPETLMNHLQKNTGGIYESAPHISDGIHSSMINSIQFLNSKIPKSMNETPLAPKFKPSNGQKQKFDRYYKIVNDPLSAMGQIKNGSLNGETMEALNATHPQLLDEMRKHIISNFNTEKAKELPYATIQSLSMFLGQPLDSSMLPSVMIANQQALQNPVQSQSNQKIMNAQPSQKDIEKLDVAGRSKTQTNQEETDEA